MKIGFIETGKIATAVVKGLCSSPMKKNITVCLSPRGKSNATFLAKKFSNVERMRNNQHVIDNSSIIFISHSFNI